MKRHSGSRQKPVPNLASMPLRTNFKSVMGTTVLLTSCACAAVDGSARGNKLANCSCDGVERDRHENRIRTGMTLRTIIKHHLDSGRAGSDDLHALHHKMSAERKGFSRV